ncbi:RhoGAP-domain-containing protein [Conidiobolus coronatus NRRL 28638]|uniref:RhoGAP-domain-containing protein n=1 Tax=Conidiobolus coronatus (strain ATCC 28846 / CBS 209.66 / NRRL 28638) TaxID=796925 RepID=A0A137NSM5_CONC2|nr:RhoGAP-domain-containing protein [Conidiobolus coronatus NRRL 28638]|eukprot:KXN65767.1 RhoGAP-domain-containing protein [Conidiobolus coronatus NRRL 28638]
MNKNELEPINDESLLTYNVHTITFEGERWVPLSEFEQCQEERVTLVTQNKSLWKVIEKQRVIIQQLQKLNSVKAGSGASSLRNKSVEDLPNQYGSTHSLKLAEHNIAQLDIKQGINLLKSQSEGAVNFPPAIPSQSPSLNEFSIPEALTPYSPSITDRISLSERTIDSSIKENSSQSIQPPVDVQKPSLLSPVDELSEKEIHSRQDITENEYQDSREINHSKKVREIEQRTGSPTSLMFPSTASLLSNEGESSHLIVGRGSEFGGTNNGSRLSLDIAQQNDADIAQIIDEASIEEITKHSGIQDASDDEIHSKIQHVTYDSIKEANEAKVHNDIKHDMYSNIQADAQEDTKYNTSQDEVQETVHYNNQYDTQDSVNSYQDSIQDTFDEKAKDLSLGAFGNRNGDKPSSSPPPLESKESKSKTFRLTLEHPQPIIAPSVASHTNLDSIQDSYDNDSISSFENGSYERPSILHSKNPSSVRSAPSIDNFHNNTFFTPPPPPSHPPPPDVTSRFQQKYVLPRKSSRRVRKATHGEADMPRSQFESDESIAANGHRPISKMYNSDPSLFRSNTEKIYSTSPDISPISSSLQREGHTRDPSFDPNRSASTIQSMLNSENNDSHTNDDADTCANSITASTAESNNSISDNLVSIPVLPSDPTLLSIDSRINILRGYVDHLKIRPITFKAKINDQNISVLVLVMGLYIILPSNDSEKPGKPFDLWILEKKYSDFMNLDGKIKMYQQADHVQLPDQSMFTSNQPHLTKARMLALKKYLNDLKDAGLGLSREYCSFLSTNLLGPEHKEAPTARPLKTYFKAGYLLKRGKKFGRLKQRYFVLNGPVMDYFETKDGFYLGSIKLAGSKIVKTIVGSVHSDIYENFTYSITILEAKKTGSVKHIFFIDNSAEWESWTSSLNYFSSGGLIAEDSPPTNNTSTTVNDNVIHKRPSMLPPPRPTQTENNHATGLVHRPSLTDLNYNSALPPTPNSVPNNYNSALPPIPSDADEDSEILPETRFNTQTSLPSTLAEDKKYFDKPLPPPKIDTHLAPSAQSEPSPSSPRDTTPTTEPSSAFKMLNAKSKVKIGLGDVLRKEKEPEKPRKAFNWTKKNFFKRSGGSGKVFGVPLDVAVDNSRVKVGYELPAVFHRCIEYMEAKEARMEEGIYRLSGSQSVIMQLKEKFDSGNDYNLLKSSNKYDVHTIAGLLKLYLRELPNSILTAKLQPDFLSITDILNYSDKVNELGRLVCILPLCNYTLLRTLIAHLIRIIEKHELNKMTLRNIGIVFAPTLAVPAGIFSLMMAEFEYVFCVNDAGNASPRLMQPDAEPNLNSLTTNITSIPIPRNKTIAQLQDGLEDRRSNCNSLVYKSSVPESLVNAERGIQFSNENPLKLSEQDELDMLNLSYIPPPPPLHEEGSHTPGELSEDEYYEENDNFHYDELPIEQLEKLHEFDPEYVDQFATDIPVEAEFDITTKQEQGELTGVPTDKLLDNIRLSIDVKGIKNKSKN